MNKSIFIVLLQFVTSVHCFAEEVACPLQLEKTEQKLPFPMKDWEAMQAYSKHILIGVGINVGDPKIPIDGDPSLSNYEIYDEDKTFKTQSGDEINVLTWDLNTISAPYLVCTYSTTSVHLIRSLKGFSKCEVRSVKKNLVLAGMKSNLPNVFSKQA